MFDRGDFHGEGKMIFPNGGYFVGVWERGKNIRKTYFFRDNLEFKENKWDYCDSNDRRFNVERKNTIKAFGVSALKNSEKNQFVIPPGCYGANSYSK